MDIISIAKLNKYFGEGENRVHILKDINLHIKKGDFVSIMGASGSGKSTLMNIIGCLDTASVGSYKVDGIETATLTADQLSDLRQKKFGFIFQRYNLLSTFNAQENVALPAIYAGLNDKKRNQQAATLLEKLGLADKLLNKPNQLSGGQQQRVSIARALMNGGEIILADEPTGALDSKSGETVMQILQELHKEGHTIILVTHDRRIAEHANRIIELKDGKIIQDNVISTDISIQNKAQQTMNKNIFSFQKDQFIESFKMSINAIIAHKLRSLLTMLGIIIGIASVVCVVALVTGAQQKVLQNISSLGTNTMDIYNGSGFGDRREARTRNLTIADSTILAEQSYIQSSTPNISVNGTLTYRNEAFRALVYGIGEQFFDVKGILPMNGYFFNADQVKNNEQVAVISENTAERLFPRTSALGEIIMINKKPLRIIGVAQTQNNLAVSNNNLSIWIPYTTAMNKISGSRNIDSITVKINNDVNSQVAEKNLVQLLTARHGKKDFFVFNTDTVKQNIESTTNVFKLLASFIALVSLVVGGIGVMNIMLVSVTERTKEIGIRMAIGARRANILQQFLTEAVLICVIGGVLGILLSVVIIVFFNSLVTDFEMVFSIFSIIASIACSTVIGIVFGYVPAKNAAKLNPIIALSRE